VSIKVVIEFEAKPGQRSALREVLEEISRRAAPMAPAFLGSTVYDVLDSPEGLIEIAEWESADGQAAAVTQAMSSGLYAPVMELVGAPFRVTRIGRPD
jgi:hypothetical protein